MEIANKVQDSSKKIASGFVALKDKQGNWIGQTVAMNQDKKVVAGQDLAFHICEPIQQDLAKNDLLIKNQKHAVLNLNQIKIDGMQAESQIAENTQQIDAEKRQTK